MVMVDQFIRPVCCMERERERERVREREFHACNIHFSFPKNLLPATTTICNQQLLQIEPVE